MCCFVVVLQWVHDIHLPIFIMVAALAQGQPIFPVRGKASANMLMTSSLSQVTLSTTGQLSVTTMMMDMVLHHLRVTKRFESA